MRTLPVILLSLILVSSCHTPEPPLEDRFSRQSGSWYDNKFSLFIHWGLYSELAGMWSGEPVTFGYSEQIQSHGGIHSDWYARTADRFNPGHWNPDAIAQLAKQAGMRSVVITAKHHDGFSLFDTQYSDFNVVQATPYGTDVIKELAEACARHGLDFGLYFSLIDWHYPPAYPISSHNADPIPEEHHMLNMNQIRELLTNYGPISELWFDMGSLEPHQSRELRDLVHALQPDCMVSGRLGNDMGDFTVMGDNQYPDYTLDTPWQTPASMFDETWGYRAWQERGDVNEKIREKLESLIMVVARGGNYLLNIGPRGDGSVVEFEARVLQAMGEWLQKNGAAIYETRAAGLSDVPDWGEVTRKEDRLYMFVLHTPNDRILRLEGIVGQPLSAHMLDNPSRQLAVKLDNEVLQVQLPDNEPFEDIRVVEVVFSEPFVVRLPTSVVRAESGEPLVLDRTSSHKHYSFSGVDYYSSFRSIVRESWSFHDEVSGRYIAELIYTEAEAGRSIELLTQEGIRLVRLQGGSNESVDADAQVHFGPLYINGPIASRIDRLTGREYPIDVQELWPGRSGSEWQRVDVLPGDRISRPAYMNQSWYAWQQLESNGASEILLALERTDGVQVFVNGLEVYTHNNPLKQETKRDLVRLQLRDGTNELLVKYYNRFGREVGFSQKQANRQVQYRKQLGSVLLTGAASDQLVWQEHDPLSIHSNMAMPGLRLVLSGQ